MKKKHNFKVVLRIGRLVVAVELIAKIIFMSFQKQILIFKIQIQIQMMIMIEIVTILEIMKHLT